MCSAFRGTASEPRPREGWRMEDGEGSRGCMRCWRVEVNKLEGEGRAKVVVHILLLDANRRVGVGHESLLPSITI